MRGHQRADVRNRLVAEAGLASPLRIPDLPVPGANLVGYLEGEFGVAEISRRMASALNLTGAPHSLISYRRTPNRQQHPFDLPLSNEAPYDTNLISLNADVLVDFAAEVGADFFARRYSIGIWFWEGSVVPDSHHAAARLLDEIWVFSEYNRRALAAVVDVPVHLMSVPMEPPKGPFASRAELELPEGFTFLFLFDFVSVRRKNPVALVQAFTRAFAPGEGPRLVLKSINGRERKPRQLQELIALTAARDDIIVRDEYVSASERDSYVAACDCYVSLHRAEGLGLTMAEAMACGKPVIATGYSGNLAFMNEANSYLVPCRLVDIPQESFEWVSGAQWAEPDTEAAAQLMRSVFTEPESARSRGEEGRADILARFSRERVGRLIGKRLEDIHALPRRSDSAHRHVVEASLVLTKGVEGAASGTRRWHPAILLRQLLIRALWPQLADQHRINSALVDAIAALEKQSRAAEGDRGLGEGVRPPSDDTSDRR